MKGLARLEYAIRELGFVGAHLYPHWFELAPDTHVLPVLRQVLRARRADQDAGRPLPALSAERPLQSVGRPIPLDTIACDFPELKLIGIHLGWPWTEEMIAVAYKHRTSTSGRTPTRRSTGRRSSCNSSIMGPRKCMFGTDFPVIDPERRAPTSRSLRSGRIEAALPARQRDRAV